MPSEIVYPKLATLSPVSALVLIGTEWPSAAPYISVVKLD